MSQIINENFNTLNDWDKLQTDGIVSIDSDPDNAANNVAKFSGKTLSAWDELAIKGNSTFDVEDGLTVSCRFRVSNLSTAWMIAIADHDAFTTGTTNAIKAFGNVLAGQVVHLYQNATQKTSDDFAAGDGYAQDTWFTTNFIFNASGFCTLDINGTHVVGTTDTINWIGKTCRLLVQCNNCVALTFWIDDFIVNTAELDTGSSNSSKWEKKRGPRALKYGFGFGGRGF